MRGRNARACRDRWVNHLCPNLATAAWTPEEDALLVSLQEQHGNRWVKIAPFFPNRTDVMVKNRFLALQRRLDPPRQKLSFFNRAPGRPAPLPRANANYPETEMMGELESLVIADPQTLSSANEFDSSYFEGRYFESDEVT
jgi:hypothetical protein